MYKNLGKLEHNDQNQEKGERAAKALQILEKETYNMIVMTDRQAIVKLQNSTPGIG